MGRWNFSWISPWAHAITHAIKVRNDLDKRLKKGNETAGTLLIDVVEVIERYNNGERTMKLYSDLFALSLKGIKKYVK